MKLAECTMKKNEGPVRKAGWEGKSKIGSWESDQQRKEIWKLKDLKHFRHGRYGGYEVKDKKKLDDIMEKKWRRE